MGIVERTFSRSSEQTCSITTQKTKSSKVAWIMNNIKGLINTKDKLKRKYIITKLETDWSNYKKVRNQVNIELRNAKNNYYSSNLLIKNVTQRKHGSQLLICLANKTNIQK